MCYFESENKINTYYQPILSALVKNVEHEFFINIDFWIEWNSGKIELLYLANEFDFPEKAKIQILNNPDILIKQKRISFAVVTRNKFRRVETTNIKLIKDRYIDVHCLVNFEWIN